MSTPHDIPVRQIPELATVAAVDAVLAESRVTPIFLFKHSETCGISAQAWDEMNHVRPDLSARLYVVSVQAGRAASDAIVARLGVRHQSPQLLLVVDGLPVWTASHFRVTGEAARRALEAHAGLAAGRPTAHDGWNSGQKEV